ncbi:MAG: AAA family ATPase [Prevotellaceae bacterium]|jgi:predicted AAA+ superfamily ATPase|nr:AAA family ATPase [Prevotellaceae bacterium]
MKNRQIISFIKDKSKRQQGRIIVLTGARQTGKSTLSKKCFDHYAYLSIEDPVQRKSYAQLTAEQWSHLFPLAILDEIQKEPVLVESIKSVYDQFDDPRYVLLGSSQLLLLHKVKESLAGRCTIIELYPLVIPELLTGSWNDTVQPSFFQDFMQNKKQVKQLVPLFTLDKNYAKKQKTFDFYLQYGGYPAISAGNLPENERFDWLAGYIRTYMERDIRDLASFRDLEPFVKLQRYLALHTASLINYSSVAKETGVTVPTVQRYFRYLDLSYQVIILPPWYGNDLKKLVKMPKIHFMDIGVLQAVLQKRGGMTGSEFESAIVSEIYKQAKNCRLPVNFYHLRTADGREVDLLLETAGYFIAIEIKMTANVTEIDARALKGLQEILTKPLLHSFVLSNDTRTKHFGDTITAVHAGAFLS